MINILSNLTAAVGAGPLVLGMGVLQATQTAIPPLPVTVPPPLPAIIAPSLASGIQTEDDSAAAKFSAPVEGKSFVERLIEHLEYLKRVSVGGDNALISPETAETARRAWYKGAEATGFALPIPAACTGPDGEMFYSWDRGRHHFEMEVIPGQPVELFYRNRETGEFWGEDWNLEEAFSPEAVQMLKLFI
jgi:hypothetical protein